MKINFIKPSSLDRNLKATLHQSGKIGFTSEAAIKMNLSIEKSLMIGVNDEDTSDKNLYVMVNSPKQEDAFPILKAGAYFYVNTKPLFKKLKWDYESISYTFEISEEEIEGEKIYKFKTTKKERSKDEKKEATD